MNFNIDFYLKAFNLQTCAVKKIIHPDAISSEVYKISIINKEIDCILKICSNAKKFEAEFNFLMLLQGQFPVPSVIASFPPTETHKGALLIEYLPGAPLNSRLLTDLQAFEMGKLLGLLHTISIIQDNKADIIDSLNDQFHRALQECSPTFQHELVLKCIHFFNNNFPDINDLDGPCINHRDFKPGNCMEYNGKICGVIDWEHAKIGSAQEDFLQMELLVWRTNAQSKKAFMEGYSTLRLLPDLKKTLPILLLIKALATVGFTIKRGTWKKEHTHIYLTNIKIVEQIVFANQKS